MRDVIHKHYLKRCMETGIDFTFKAYPECHLPDIENQAEIMEQVETGEVVYFLAGIEAGKAGVVLATTYLGECIYESFEQFYENLEECYIADMIDEAKEEALEVIAKLVA